MLSRGLKQKADLLALGTATSRAPTNMKSWGYHLMLDCSGCCDINDQNQIYSFVKDLIQQIDMVAHGEPVIEYLLPGEPNQGYSLMQLITTSNICGHFMELDGTAYFDVFSCKEFDSATVEKVVKHYFNPKKIKSKLIKRQA
jgi:S-adenosylmethionine/arginine decarboxylase-like enzyme